MKKSYIVLIVLAVVVVVLFLVYGKGSAQGKVVFAVTDATADIKNVSSINITVNEISVHSEGSGWVVVSTATKEFDLLQLKSEGALELATEANLKVGTYDQVRLNISKVVVVKEGQSIEAKLPSNKMTLTGTLVVNADTTSTITFDFLADKSLHMTGNGKFILVPVVRLETKSGADVSFEGKKVKILGGKIEHENTQGMDENGKVKVGNRFDDKDELDEIDGVIKVKSSGENEAVLKITAREAIDKGIASGLATILSLKLKTENGQTLWKVTGLQNLEMKTVYIDAMTGLVVSVKDNDDDEDKDKDDDGKNEDEDKDENNNDDKNGDKNDDDSDNNGEEVKLNLSSQNNSGIAGTVKLENKDGKVEVKLNLIGVSTGVTGLLGISLNTSHPAHIHLGSCANIGAVKYPLISTVNGESETKISASFADLKAQLPLAVNVHKSSEEIGVYVACADIKF
jgi:hypothetical protein